MELEKIPLLSFNQKLTLTGFNQNNAKFLSNLNLKNSKLNKNLLILNKAVNANLVLTKDYNGPRQSGALISHNCQVVKNETEEYELASQLIDLIGNCNPNILKKKKNSSHNFLLNLKESSQLLIKSAKSSITCLKTSNFLIFCTHKFKFKFRFARF